MRLSLLLTTLVFIAGCASPDYGKDGLPARAHEKQISNDTYAITAYVGAFKTPAMLKPLVVARARAIGKSRGFKAFMFESADVDYDMRGNGFGAATVVKFSNAALRPIAGLTYAVDDVDRFETEVASVDTSRLAKLTGSSDPGIRSNNYTPVWYDAVSGSGNASSSAIGYLRPGLQRLYVRFWVFRSGFLGNPDIGYVPMEAEMQAGRSYVTRGRMNEDVLEIWLEDEALKKPVGRPVIVPFRR